MKQILFFDLVKTQQFGVHLLLPCKVNSQKYYFIIDTGASNTVLDTSVISGALYTSYQEKAYSLNKFQNLFYSLGVADQNIQISFARITHISIGDFFFENQIFPSLDMFSIREIFMFSGYKNVFGILGNDFLLQVNALINYQTQQITMESDKREIILPSYLA